MVNAPSFWDPILEVSQCGFILLSVFSSICLPEKFSVFQYADQVVMWLQFQCLDYCGGEESLTISYSVIHLLVWFQGWVDNHKPFLLMACIYLIGQCHPVGCVLDGTQVPWHTFSSGCIVLFIGLSLGSQEDHRSAFVWGTLSSESQAEANRQGSDPGCTITAVLDNLPKPSEIRFLTL